MPVKVLKEFPEVMRKSDFDISGVIRGNELLSMSNSHGNDMYGVAVDIGTTTLVAYLVDMATGQQKVYIHVLTLKGFTELMSFQE